MGGELKATVSDEDGVPQDGIKYQWQRDGADIKDATGATYKLTADDAGHKISVKAEYQDNGKHAEAPTSEATEIPQDTPNHAPTGSVTISGMAQAGQTLHAGNTLADEDGMGEVNYQWLRDGKTIDGATGGQYTLTADDVGHSISVKASYTDGKAHAESKDSLSSLKPAAEGTAPTYEKDYGEPTVDWAGFKWVARGGGFKEGGPQANHQWSKDNAHLDGTNMELSITNADKHTPVASEIVSTRAMGYGTYEATFHADFSKFDKYSVFGFFTFDWSQDKVDDGYREIDAVEISRWGDSVLKGTTTYYPHTSEKGVHPQPDSVWPENWTHGTVKLEWTPQKISWTLRNADTGEEVTKDITSDIVKPANQQMHFNLWTYKPGKDTKTDGWLAKAKFLSDPAATGGVSVADAILAKMSPGIVVSVGSTDDRFDVRMVLGHADKAGLEAPVRQLFRSWAQGEVSRTETADGDVVFAVADGPAIGLSDDAMVLGLTAAHVRQSLGAARGTAPSLNDHDRWPKDALGGLLVDLGRAAPLLHTFYVDALSEDSAEWDEAARALKDAFDAVAAAGVLAGPFVDTPAGFEGTLRVSP